MSKAINPITRMDYPDPDVIRVGNTFYMVSTTMHFFPGCEILRSFDLVNWEHASFVYETLDSTPAQKLEEGQIYGKGMWAATIRYHKGIFYIIFVANDTHKTYLYRAEEIGGPWRKSNIEGFYHDCSLLFDDDDEAYLVYGNRNIYLTQLNKDLTGPKEGGLHRLILSDKDNPSLGYEGTHFYKINGKYYVFFIHSLPDRWRRVEACFIADSLDGEFRGGDCFNDDRNYCGAGVAQGGIVDTEDGKWYALLFQDSGAVGRMPILLPVTWDGEWPVFGVDGKVPETFETPNNNPGYEYAPLVGSDDFISATFKPFWQWNHEPDMDKVKVDVAKGNLCLENGKLCNAVTEAKNVLTQRMTYPGCVCEITVDASSIKEGDYAGICAFQGCFAAAGVTKRDGRYYAVMMERNPEDYDAKVASKEAEAVLLPGDASCIRFKVEVDFTFMKDEAKLFFDSGNGYQQIGPAHKLFFRLDHFTGCRVGLYSYATKELGGKAKFSKFQYNQIEELTQK